MARKRKRGRPFKFKARDRQVMSELVRTYGARGAREVCKKPVSVHTLLKIAHEFGIELQKGRRPKAA